MYVYLIIYRCIFFRYMNNVYHIGIVTYMYIICVVCIYVCAFACIDVNMKVFCNDIYMTLMCFEI